MLAVLAIVAAGTSSGRATANARAKLKPRQACMPSAVGKSEQTRCDFIGSSIRSWSDGIGNSFSQGCIFSPDDLEQTADTSFTCRDTAVINLKISMIALNSTAFLIYIKIRVRPFASALRRDCA
jgi:hypothetical protein